MNKLSLTDKRNRSTTETQTDKVAMTRPGVLMLEASRADITGIEREGNRIVVRYRDGRRLVVEDFFRADSSGLIGDVVLREPDGSLYWWSNPLQDWGMARLEPLASIDPLLLTEPANAGMVVAAFAPGGGLLGVLAGAGLIGAAAAAGGGSGGGSNSGGTLPPAGGGTTVPAGGTPVVVNVPAANDGLSLTEVNSGVVVNITLPSAAVAGDRITVTVDGRSGTVTTLSAADITAGRIAVILPSSSLMPAGEGTAVVLVTVTDPAGVARPGSPGSVAVSVDVMAPTLLNANPSSYADNVGAVQSAVSREPITDDATPGLNIGTIPAGTTPLLYANGLRVAATYSPSTGTLTPNSALPNGTHDLSYSLSDAAGNESPRSGALRLTVSAGAALGMSIAVPENNGGGISTTEAADGVVVVVTLPNTLSDAQRTSSSSNTGPSLVAAEAGRSQALAALPGDRVTVRIDDGLPVTVVLTAADVAAGRVNVTLPLSAIQAAGQGSGIVSAVYTTSAGVVSEPVTTEVFIDTDPPVLGVPTPTSYVDNVGPVQDPMSTAPVTDDTTPGLNIGTVPSGTTAILYVNGLAVASVYDPATGSLTPVSPLPNGQVRLTYSLRDDVGNESPISNPLVLTISTGSPSGMSITVPENADGGINAAEAADGTPVIVSLPVGAAAGERIEVSINGGTAVNATLSAADVAAGRITVTLPNSALVAAGQGAGTVSAVYTTAAGVTSAPATADVLIDTLAPTLTNANPSSYNDNVGPVQNPMSTAPVTDDTTPGLNIGSIPEDVVAILLINGTPVPSEFVNGVLTPLSPLPNGPADLAYRLRDTAGNESPISAPLRLTISTNVPVGMSITVPENADGGINAAEAADGTPVIVSLPVGAAAGERIAVSINGGTAVNATLSAADVAAGRITVTLPNSALVAAGQGAGTVSAVYTTAAGVTSAPATADVFIDTLAPTLTNANPSSYADNVGPVQNAMSTAPVTDDTTPGLNIGSIPEDVVAILLINGTPVPSEFVNGVLTPLSPLPNGPADLAYRLRDAAGNESPISAPLRLTIGTNVPVGMSITVPENADGGINAAEAADGTPVVVSLPVGAAAGERIAVSIDGGTAVNATLSAADVAAGRITVTLPNSALVAAGQGAGTVSAVYTTAAGVTSAPATADVLINTLAPTLTNANPSSYADNVGPVQNPMSTEPVTDDTTPGLNIGAIPAGTTPILLVNGTPVSAEFVNGVLTPLSPLPNGPADLAYRLRDTAGNESPASAPLRLTISTAAPGALAVSVPENSGGGISAAEAADGIQAVVVLPTGSAAGESVSVRIGSGTAATATITAADAAAGRVTVTIPAAAVTAAGQGANTVTATYTNAAGLASSPASTDIFIDTVAPGAYTVTVPENAGGGISAAEAADGVAVVVALPTNAAVGDVVSVNIDGGTIVQVTVTQADVTARQVTVVLPASAIAAAGEGAGAVRTVYTDAAGNPSGSSPQTTNVTIDTVAPTLTNVNPNSYQDNVGIFQSPMSMAPVTDDNTPGLVIGAVPAGATATLYVNGNAVASIYDAATGTLRPSAGLPDGAYDLSYSLRDGVGNESARSGTLRLTVDTTPPQGTPSSITSYRDDVGAIQGNNSVASATDDARPGLRIGSLPADAASAQLFVDGMRVDAIYDAATGTLTPNQALLASGAVQSFQISYTLSDAAGNQSAASANFALTVDTQAPTLNISQSTQPGVPALTFKFSEAVTGFVAGDVTVTNGTLLNFTRVDDLTYTANVLPTGLSAPAVSVAAGSYTDSVGNAGAAASLATTLTDTTPPVLQSASTTTDGRSLILVYNEALDAVNTPALNAFTVLTGTPPTPNAVTALSVSGNVVTLTLTNAITAGAGINLAYADPTPNNDMRAIQDVAGNDAATQVSVAVVNQVTAPPPITATISIEPAALAVGQTATVTITFSALPTGFALGDLSAENGTLSALSTIPVPGAGGSVSYTATFTPSANVNDPSNVITLAAGSYTDVLGRPGGGATSPNYEVNTTNPSAPITATIVAISEDTLTGVNTTTSDFITNDRTLTVSGSINRELTTGENVQIQIDGGAWQDVLVNPTEPTVWYLGLGTALATGPHTFAARVVDGTGQVVGAPTTQNATIVGNVAPVVATSTNGGLLGIISLDALGGVLNLSQQQVLSAVDVDNNLRQVVVSTGGVANLLNLGTITASQPIAAELGLRTVAATTGGLLGVGATNSLTITALDGGELDNLRIGELLATLNLNGGAPLLSLTALTGVTIAATDANNLTTTANGNVTALSLSALSLVQPGTVVLGTAGNDALTGDGAANRLYGFGGTDTLNGGAGDDLLRGGAGADLLLGGAGDDLLIYDAADTTIDGGQGVDVLRVEATGQLNMATGSNVRNIETINLGKGDGRSTAVISAEGLLANGVQTILIEGDQEDAVTLQGATFNGQVLVGRQAFLEYLITAANGQVFSVRIEDGVPITPAPISVIGGGG